MRLRGFEVNGLLVESRRGGGEATSQSDLRGDPAPLPPSSPHSSSSPQWKTTTTTVTKVLFSIPVIEVSVSDIRPNFWPTIWSNQKTKTLVAMTMKKLWTQVTNSPTICPNQKTMTKTKTVLAMTIKTPCIQVTGNLTIRSNQKTMTKTNTKVAMTMKTFGHRLRVIQQYGLYPLSLPTPSSSLLVKRFSKILFHPVQAVKKILQPGSS